MVKFFRRRLSNGEGRGPWVWSAAVLLTLCVQATVTASTSYSFGTTNNISLASEPTAYTAGSWTEAAYPNTTSTSQQIDCVAAVANILMLSKFFTQNLQSVRNT